jgi:hypothetical protein
MGVGTFATVIVPRSAYEAAKDPNRAGALATAVVRFANAMTGQGLYTRDELLPKVIQAFHADYYLAQVNNGGHGQFIHNSFANFDYALADVRAAMTTIGTEPYASIVEQLIAECAVRRDPVTRKIDLSIREQPDVLSVLDREFYAADKAVPFQKMLGRWIATWPELRAVEDADFPEAIRHAAWMNPLREVRRQWQSVTRLRGQTTDRFMVGVGLACVKMEPSELRLSIGAGFGVEIDGVAETAFTVRTNRCPIRACVVKPEYAAAYEFIPADMPKTVAAKTGAQLSRVSGLMIDDVVDLARKYRAGLAIDLVLRRAGVDPADANVVALRITPHARGDLVKWLLSAGDRFFAALTTPDGAALMPGESDETLAMVGMDDLNAHADHIGAGSMEPKPL